MEQWSFHMKLDCGRGSWDILISDQFGVWLQKRKMLSNTSWWQDRGLCYTKGDLLRVGMAVQWEWCKEGAGSRRRWYYTLRNIGCWSEICGAEVRGMSCSVGRDDAGRTGWGSQRCICMQKTESENANCIQCTHLKPHSKTQELITRACQGAGDFFPFWQCVMLSSSAEAAEPCRKLHSDWMLAVTSSSYIHHCTLYVPSSGNADLPLA